MAKSIKNSIYTRFFTPPEKELEQNASLGKATLEEFQKELTFISIDLMKVRSSFALNFDPKEAIKSCDFKNLHKPACLLTKAQEQAFQKQANKIQASLASELANILSSQPDLNSGLLKRTSNECEIKDSDAIFARMRFTESLINPDLIIKLKKLNIPNGTSLAKHLKEKKTTVEFESTINDISHHPLLKVLFNDTEKLNVFLNEFHLNNNELSETNNEIIEKLYEKKYANEFGDDIKNRCKKAFTRTNLYLDQIYCKKEPTYIADDYLAMEAINGSQFKSMTKKQAEESLKSFCFQFNNSKKSATSFNSIRQDICGSNDKNLIKFPLKEFRDEAYNSFFWNSQNNMCISEKEGKCVETSKDQGCKMLHYLNQSKTSKQYQELAKASGDNINLILRSLIGNGIPQKDGKPDSVAISLLKSEGIFPDGKNSSRPQQKEAATFHNNEKYSNAVKDEPIQRPSNEFIPDKKQSRSDSNPYTNTEAIDDKNNGSVKDQDSLKKKIGPGRKFSNLTDTEMKNVMNRFGKSNKKIGNEISKMNNEIIDKLKDPRTSGEGSPNSKSGTNSSITQINQINQIAPHSNNGPQATLDPKKIDKDASYNAAKMQAQQNRTPTNDAINTPTFSLSKTISGLNKIEIKVQDESILDKKAPELEKKIQEYLDKSGQSLQGAKTGEAFFVKLGKFEIKVAINDYGVYVATCKDNTLHPEYLAFLSKYFTGIKSRVNSRESMENIINESKKKI